MNELLGLLKGVAPSLATAVAGPLGGAAVTALASKFGVSDSVDAVAKAIAGDPKAAEKLAAKANPVVEEAPVVEASVAEVAAEEAVTEAVVEAPVAEAVAETPAEESAE